MLISVNLVKKLEQIEPALREVLIAVLEEIERQREETVTKSEFNELKEIVRELAQAQKRTEEGLDSLARRVDELVEAQKRTEKRVEELAQAQKRTEEALLGLIKEHAKTREQLGGLSNTVGYILENEAMRALPKLLLEEFGLVVKGRLVRKFVEDDKGHPVEVNIIGEADRDGERFLVLGESKSQLSKNGVREFLDKKLKRIPKPPGLEFFPILVTHMITSADVVEYALSKGIKRVYYSYEF
ncbi:MAG: chordopoxvirus fusion protein [Thermodesulfobacteriota bacterium]